MPGRAIRHYPIACLYETPKKMLIYTLKGLEIVVRNPIKVSLRSEQQT